MSAYSTVSRAGPRTPQNVRTSSSIQSGGVPGITTVLEAFHRDMCHDVRWLDPHNVEVVDRVALSLVSTNSHNVQKETVDGGVHRVATATSITVLLSCFSSMSTSDNGEYTDLHYPRVV
jgi:hypothetical protein